MLIITCSLSSLKCCREYQKITIPEIKIQGLELLKLLAFNKVTLYCHLMHLDCMSRCISGSSPFICNILVRMHIRIDAQISFYIIQKNIKTYTMLLCYGILFCLIIIGYSKQWENEHQCKNERMKISVLQRSQPTFRFHIYAMYVSIFKYLVVLMGKLND